MNFLFFTVLIVYIKCERIYSKVSFNETLIHDSGIHFATFENVCFQNLPSSIFQAILFYVRDSDDVMPLAKYITSHKIGSLVDSLGFMIKEYPQINIEENEVWFTRGCCRTIFHFMDFVSFWLMNRNSSFYPPLEYLIFTQYQPNTFYEWHSVLYNVLIPKHVKVKFGYDFSKMLRKEEIICFKKIHYMIRSENGNYGMVYRNIEIRKEFRDHCYEYMKMEYNKIDKINSLFIYRKIKVASRILINQNDVVELMKMMGIEMRVEYFDDKSIKEQIEIIKNANLIVNIYGSSLTNLLWLNSDIAFVIELTGIYVFSDFHRYATVNGYKYLSIFTTDYNIDYKELYKDYKFEDFPCIHQSVEYYHPLKETSGNDIRISLNQLRNGIYFGMNYLKYSISHKQKQ